MHQLNLNLRYKLLNIVWHTANMIVSPINPFNPVTTISLGNLLSYLTLNPTKMYIKSAPYLKKRANLGH